MPPLNKTPLNHELTCANGNKFMQIYFCAGLIMPPVVFSQHIKLNVSIICEEVQRTVLPYLNNRLKGELNNKKENNVHCCLYLHSEASSWVI